MALGSPLIVSKRVASLRTPPGSKATASSVPVDSPWKEVRSRTRAVLRSDRQSSSSLHPDSDSPVYARSTYAATMVSSQNYVPWASSETARRVMQSNRGRDSGPEMRLRTRLHSLGLRYRVGLRVEKDLRRTVDIAFTGQKVAVFVDGCFWHGCPLHARDPKTNSDFWVAKISRNKKRDEDTNDELRMRGWRVVRYWEHDDPAEAAREIGEIVESVRQEKAHGASRTTLRASARDNVLNLEE
jgi:DNA mismatch endonuclease, patch repair protein